MSPSLWNALAALAAFVPPFPRLPKRVSNFSDFSVTTSSVADSFTTAFSNTEAIDLNFSTSAKLRNVADSFSEFCITLLVLK